MMCIFETYVDSSPPDDDPRLNLPGYNLVRADNPNSTKRRWCLFTLLSHSLFVR